MAPYPSLNTQEVSHEPSQSKCVPQMKRILIKLRFQMLILWIINDPFVFCRCHCQCRECSYHPFLAESKGCNLESPDNKLRLVGGRSAVPRHGQGQNWGRRSGFLVSQYFHKLCSLSGTRLDKNVSSFTGILPPRASKVRSSVPVISGLAWVCFSTGKNIQSKNIWS